MLRSQEKARGFWWLDWQERNERREGPGIHQQGFTPSRLVLMTTECHAHDMTYYYSHLIIQGPVMHRLNGIFRIKVMGPVCLYRAHVQTKSNLSYHQAQWMISLALGRITHSQWSWSLHLDMYRR